MILQAWTSCTFHKAIEMDVALEWGIRSNYPEPNIPCATNNLLPPMLLRINRPGWHWIHWDPLDLWQNEPNVMVSMEVLAHPLINSLSLLCTKLQQSRSQLPVHETHLLPLGSYVSVTDARLSFTPGLPPTQCSDCVLDIISSEMDNSWPAVGEHSWAHHPSGLFCHWMM